MWWCIATLTTVGYGDETPKTNSGKVVGAFAMVSGILIIALPVSVLGTNFSGKWFIGYKYNNGLFVLLVLYGL